VYRSFPDLPSWVTIVGTGIHSVCCKETLQSNSPIYHDPPETIKINCVYSWPCFVFRYFVCLVFVFSKNSAQVEVIERPRIWNLLREYGIRRIVFSELTRPDLSTYIFHMEIHTAVQTNTVPGTKCWQLAKKVHLTPLHVYLLISNQRMARN